MFGMDDEAKSAEYDRFLHARWMPFWPCISGL